ncbi:hypothetical protein GCM10007147_31270 [Nocardiopsis kunsanensis]|uniref:DoxX family protein n=1 Tax=Nocardiopsis kunsanensis TaxID=141693 RepID=A0A919CIW1_9ACTN|nr:hypothetical protein [Nocardiopsis kunsanensis]GHD29920.1 hypothetical protein GCM10007147_31270 [Nocardiopsis kunsanensis]
MSPDSTDHGPPTSASASSAPDPGPAEPVPSSGRTEDGARPRWWVTALWMGHGLLRMGLFSYLLVYGWTKLILMQMGQADYGRALTTMGEKSPMGLLWDFIAYAPTVQFLSGLVEVLAAVLLIWRRTAWLGGLLGAGAMGVVFLLNMAYDVPVKQLALAMAIGCLLVALPELRRLGGFLAGRPVGAITPPRPVPWPRVHAFTRWVFGSLGVLIAVAPSAAVPMMWPSELDSPLPGVYRVVEDTAEPAGQLAEDERWQAIAFGQYDHGDMSQLAIRTADGDLLEGTYTHDSGGGLELRLREPLKGDRPLNQEPRETVELTWQLDDGGRLHLEGEGHELIAEPDPELTYLHDRGFRWAPGPPVNR